MKTKQLSYYAQTQHPLWQKKRLEVLELHEFTCQDCHSQENTLHVHHPFYKRGAMIWEYDKEELQVLCEVCHKNAHEVDERIKKLLGYANSYDKEFVYGYLNARHKIKEYEDFKDIAEIEECYEAGGIYLYFKSEPEVNGIMAAFESSKLNSTQYCNIVDIIQSEKYCPTNYILVQEIIDHIETLPEVKNEHK